MAKVKIQGHASGTGVLTVTAPNTSTDRTITLPDATATLATNENFTSTGIDDNADATSITIDSSEGVGIKNTASDSMYYKGLAVGDGGASDQGINIYSSAWGALAFADSTSGDGRYEGSVAYNHSTNSMYLATNHATALQITSDGRGLSQFTAKAWCNFRQTDHVIVNSHNVSSVSDIGVGNSRVVFTNAMANVNYTAIASAAPSGGSHNDNLAVAYDSQNTTAQAGWLTYRTSSTAQADADRHFSIYFGD